MNSTERTTAVLIVTGVVLREDGVPLSGARMRATHQSKDGAIRLGEDITQGDGRYTIRYAALPGGDAINLEVSALDEDGRTIGSPRTVKGAKLIETINLKVPIGAPGAEGRTLEGAILFEHGLAAEGLTLRLCRRGFNGTLEKLAEVETVRNGRYAFSLDAKQLASSLEIFAVMTEGGKEVGQVPLSKPMSDLARVPGVPMNFVVPVKVGSIDAEYRRLATDLKEHIGNDIGNLKDAKENNDQQDLTVLNRATGWDARLIALASVAQRLVADVKLPPEALYGLLRAGLPSDKLLLAQFDPDIVEVAIKKVSDAGVVKIDDADIPNLKKKFTEFATKTQMAVPAPGSRSTYEELLAGSGLPKDAQDKFAPIYLKHLKHQGSASQLWEAARAAGLDGKQIGTLRLQGKLAFLAGNSDAMTKRLVDKKLQDPAKLAAEGFYVAGKWKTELFELASIPPERHAAPTTADLEAVGPLIPATTYAATKVEDRLEAYAQDMARKIRLSYPTQVLQRQLESVDKFKLAFGHDATVALLKDATAQGFRLGETPVSRFLQSRSGVGDALSAADRHTATEQLKVIQRVYQITPGNEAMPVLMKLGMTSAFDVAAYPEKQFIALFNVEYLKLWGKPAPTGAPELIIRKAKQVSSVTYNLFAVARKLDTESPIMAISGTAQQHAEAKAALKDALKAYPTMESLFGSMDYCECEHCRSVLSPAAYLVDLLQFVDAEPAVWSNFLVQWKADPGAEYQAAWNKKPDGSARGEADRKPYDALIERRPDLPHIALTCENTHTALPYIDVVNEVLEYYVVNGRLAKETAQDTGDATTAELLAEPQHVSRQAYDELQKARYPLSLPFDLWLETVRKSSDYFETPLHRVLETVRPDEDVSTPIQGPSNIGNATVNIANADAARLATGMTCSYQAKSTGSSSGEWKVISAIASPDSGGAGQTTVTFAGTWLTAPSEEDRLVSRPLDRRAAIFIESLGLSPAEVEIFANRDPLPKWHELYGFANAPDALTEAVDPATGQRRDLHSAKALSRRLGVTYKEIAEIVQTRFVNPDLGKLSLLYKLDISVRDAKLYKDERAFYEANKGLLGADRNTLSAADQQRFDELGKKRSGRDLTGWDVLHEVGAIEQRLALFAEEFKPGTSVADLRDAIQEIPFNSVVVLADPDAGCNFDQTTLQYADGAKADGIVFLRINLFVRLWRKLGWSIEETDHALTTFMPRSAPFDAASLAERPLWTALVYLAHLKELDVRLKVGKQGRQKLLTLWSDIATAGKKPLYAQLFLNRGVLRSSPVFDHPLGQYLTNATVKLKDHALALQGALGLTADEIGRIMVDAGKSVDTAELSLPNVSLLYRYGVLAKALKLPVRDLIVLKQESGLDPFKPLHDDPLVTLDQDQPFVQTLEFVKVAEEVKDSGLKIEDLDYLLRHRFDATGKYRPNRDNTLALLKSLSAGVRAIRAEHAVPDNPEALSEEVLRQKLGLALRPDVVERFLAMVNTSVEFTATVRGLDKANELAPLIDEARQLAGEGDADASRIRDARYAEVPHKEQKLTVRGVVFDAGKTALKDKLGSTLSAVQRQAFADLLDDLEKLAREFFDNQLKKQNLRLPGEAGFLADADFAELFAPLKPLKKIAPTDSPAEVDSKQKDNEKTEEKNQKALRERRLRIGQSFFPFLLERLIHQFIVQTLTARTGSDPVLVESLLGDDRMLAARTRLLDVYAATAVQGLDATFWLTADATGAPQPAVTLTDADTGARVDKGNPLLAGADSARFDAYLEVPAAGAYRFYVVLDKNNAQAALSFPHLAEPVLVKGTAGADGATLGDQADEYVELKAGVLYRFALELKHLNGGEGRLLVQGESMPKGPLSQLALYPAAAVEAAERAWTLLGKSLQLVQGLGLGEREIRYLVTHAHDFDGVSLSELPVGHTGDSPSDRAATSLLFGRFRRLAAYARLKRDLAGRTDDLISIFEANGTAAADRLEKSIYPLIAKITRRDEPTVKATAEALVKPPAGPAFESEKPVGRLWEALKVVERFGVPPPSLRLWADLLSTTAGPRRFEIARDLKEAIRARFEPEAWQRVAQPIFDQLRPLQRNALVSHVLQQLSQSPKTASIDTVDKLHEYFLIDPGMEPVVQTSRIRLAIASLQLFIQRCLLNLEPNVHPTTVNAEQWEWMKRYRVWEANRKIFLFPENWLEPEFRDDKTHLFTELEGALLQGDVSSDLAEDAFLKYLKKLDELARLDICAMHIENNLDPTRRVLHVFGRTYSQPHKYFYRRYARQMWTPWEPVNTEIEGDHLAPVVWRDRLYLFWVTFLDKPLDDSQSGPSRPGKKLVDSSLSELTAAVSANGRRKQMDVQLHWSEYLAGEWTTRESSAFTPITTTQWIPGHYERPKVGDTRPRTRKGFIWVEATGQIEPLIVPLTFDRASVFVHVSKEPLEDGAEGGVYVNLIGGRVSQSFFVAGRNSAPEASVPSAPPANPFDSANTPSANRYVGSGALKVTYRERITTAPGKTPPPGNPDVLGQGELYSLMPCDTHLSALGVPEDAYQGAVKPEAVEAALKSGLNEISSLMRPVFYQDSRHTFFVEPDLSERTIEEWQGWVTTTAAPELAWTKPDWWKAVVIIPEIPRKGPTSVPGVPWSVPIHSASIIKPPADRDWLINPASAVKFGDVLIGPTGQAGIEIRAGVDPGTGFTRVNTGLGGDLASGSAVVVSDPVSFAQSGLQETAGGLNVVGAAGFNSALAKNWSGLNRSGFGRPGFGRAEQ